MAALTTRRTGGLPALLLCAALLPADGAAAEPDRAAWESAERGRRALESSGERMKSRREWDRVIGLYRDLVRRFPRSGYSDNALLAVGDLSHSVADRLGLPAYDAQAVRAWKALVAEYPSSRHCERAQYSVWQVERRAGRARGEQAGVDYLARFGSAEHAAEVRSYLSEPREPRRSVERPTPDAIADVMNLRFWSGESTTRVVLDLEQAVPVKYDRLHDPERLYLDLIGTRLAASLTDRTFPVGDGLLEQVRIGQNRPEVVRVVLDFREVEDHRIFYLKAPARLVIDVKGEGDPAAARRADAAPAGPTEQSAAVRSSGSERRTAAPPAGREAPADAPAAGSPEEPARAAAAATAPDEDLPRGWERPADREKPARTADATPPAPAAAAEDAPESPEANTDGSFSIARQLGLGARRIVIDPGHGGHDPGSIGRGGLREKDVVLDVALRLEKLLRERLGAEVVMTRRTDVFIPLEERTAIANSKAADLFLSIHANSARNRSARGIETYYLSFAADPHAEELAARENSISRATLGDLQDLVKAITLNSKLDESRDFAKAIQTSLVERTAPHYSAVRDRGVRTAPLYVLIGANMPSVLAELGFISNPNEEQQLRSADHREVMARSLLGGLESYLAALNRTQVRQLTASRAAPTVGEDEGSR